MSVRSSMYRMVFTLILCPFLVFSLLIIYIYSGRLEKVITDSLYVVASAQIAEMTNFCEQQKEYCALIGSMDISQAAMEGQLDEKTSKYLDDMLYSQIQTMSYMRTMTIIDRDYRVVACSEEHPSYAEDGISLVIESMGSQSFYITGVLNDSEGNQTLVAISRVEEDGELLGYTLAELSLDFYREIRERAELWNDATFYLLDGNQQIISAGTANENRQSFVTTEKEREDYQQKYQAIDFEKNPQGSFRYKIDGVDYITYYSDVEYTDWRVLLSVNFSNYQAQKTVYFVLAFFLVLLCALLAVWIGGFVSKRIIHPIRHISETLKAIQEKQDYSLRIDVQRKDELGNLAGEINGLVDYIETEDLYKARKQRLLEEKAGQDALTKVLNKERIMLALNEAVNRHFGAGTAMAVCFVDVDNFKQFNDNYGHSVGDQVLLFLTSLLASETHGTVGRMGGDEFLVIVEEPQYVQNLDTCLEKIKEAAGLRFVVRGSGTHLCVSCCIGAVRLDGSGKKLKAPTPEQLVDLADAAMYQVKNGGKHGHAIVEY